MNLFVFVAALLLNGTVVQNIAVSAPTLDACEAKREAEIKEIRVLAPQAKEKGYEFRISTCQPAAVFVIPSETAAK